MTKYFIIAFFFISCRTTQPATGRIPGVLYTSELRPYILEGDTITEKGLGRTFTALAKSVSQLKKQMDSVMKRDAPSNPYLSSNQLNQVNNFLNIQRTTIIKIISDSLKPLKPQITELAKSQKKDSVNILLLTAKNLAHDKTILTATFKADSLQNLIKKYAMRFSLAHFDTTGNVMQIRGWNTVLADIINLKSSVSKLQPPGGH